MTRTRFRSAFDWQNFSKYIKDQNRYTLSGYWQEFFEILKETAKKRIIKIPKGAKCFRARKGSSEWQWHHAVEGELTPGDWGGFGPLPCEKMGPPPSTNATEGRMNPRGIAYLYLASDPDTAIAELRPWLREYVSVARFESTRELMVLDTSKDGPLDDRNKEEDQYTVEEKEQNIWWDINRALATPVSRDEPSIEYVPSQYVTEVFKAQGLDGIVYRSSLNAKGANMVLFNPCTVSCIDCKLYQIDKIRYEHHEL